MTNPRLIFLLFIFFYNFVLIKLSFADTVYPIKKFSSRYHAEMVLDNHNELKINVYDKDNKILFPSNVVSVDSNIDRNFAMDSLLDDIKQGAMSAIVYDDINFDGIKDFVLINKYFQGFYTSYNFYLANKNGTFSYNKAFSDLTDKERGYPYIINDTLVFSKLSQSWLYDVYEVKHNTPVPKCLMYESFINDLYSQRKIYEYNSGEERKIVKYFLYDSDDNANFSFKLKDEKNKKVILFENDEGLMDYVLLGDKDVLNSGTRQIEFSALLALHKMLQWQRKDKEDDSIWELKPYPKFYYYNGKLSFHIENTLYTVIDDGNRLGVEVKDGHRIKFFAGIRSDGKNLADSLVGGKFKNIVFEH